MPKPLARLSNKTHADKPRLKKFQNSITTLTINRTGVQFNVGEAVQIGARIKGVIAAFGANAKGELDGSVLLSSGDVVEYQKMKHSASDDQQNQIPVKVPDQQTPTKKPPTNDECDALKKRVRQLEKELENCTRDLQTRDIPTTAQHAPADVIEKLPEIRQQNITEDIDNSIIQLTEAVKEGDTAEVRAIEKNIENSFQELKTVAAQETASATAGCRVIVVTFRGKKNIRIYFAEKPPHETYLTLSKNGFGNYHEDFPDGRKREYYYGSWYNKKNLDFAMQFCKEDGHWGAEFEYPEDEPQITKAKKTSDFTPLTDEEMGNLWGAKRVAAIREELNAAYPDYKFSVTKSDSNGVNVSILSAPIKLTDEKEEGVNHYHIDDNYEGQVAEVLNDIVRIMKRGVTYHETGDYGNQPDFYINLNIGTYEKPFVFAPNPNARITNQLTHNHQDVSTTKAETELQQTAPAPTLTAALIEDVNQYNDQQNPPPPTGYAGESAQHLFYETVYKPTHAELGIPLELKTFNEFDAYLTAAWGLYKDDAYARKKKKAANLPFQIWFRDVWRIIFLDLADKARAEQANAVKGQNRPTTVPPTTTSAKPQKFTEIQIINQVKDFYVGTFRPAHTELDIPLEFQSLTDFKDYLDTRYEQSGTPTSQIDWFNEVWKREWLNLLEQVRADRNATPKNPRFYDSKSDPKSSSNKKIQLSPLLKEIMPKHQQEYLAELRGESVQELQEVVNDIEHNISVIKKRQDKGYKSWVYAHYFNGGSDWYVTEYQGDGIIYGFAILNGDYQNSEFGTAFVSDFSSPRYGEMDFYWTPQPLDEVLYEKAPNYYPNPHPDHRQYTPPSQFELRPEATKGETPPHSPQPVIGQNSTKDAESAAALKDIREMLATIAAAAKART